ncbi:hypothetical protein GR197_30890 [Rhizobium phaseoli]|uniref:Uncharacterized protein n=1 Tax=Rhizobium phaseoli TaxID=396 RepID=A0A7K3UNL8_9HYPH|nr:hypothetical protein [Rhizobium phaseoli]NEJ74874.1 hypothetical protein [Rhizobium phaseoli]
MSKQAADVPPVLFWLKAARPERCHVRTWIGTGVSAFTASTIVASMWPGCALLCSRLHFTDTDLPAIRKGRKQAFDASEDETKR